MEGLDRALAHALGDDGGLDEVAAELREEHPATHGPDLVPGATHALETGGDRGRRLDLDDEVDRAHVDAQLETARRDDGRQGARLEGFLDLEALLAADRSVVGTGQDRRGTRRSAGLRHDLRRRPSRLTCRRRRPRVVDRPIATAFGGLESVVPDLVEASREPLGEPARVGEDDRRAVLGDEVDDALLDMGPDRGARLGSGRRPGQVSRRIAQLTHVRDRDDDLEVPLLGRGRLDDRHGPPTGEITRDLLDRSNRGREADPLSGLRQQGVEPLEAEREVGAPLGSGEGVDLVDDDRLDADERLPRGRGQQQEE